MGTDDAQSEFQGTGPVFRRSGWGSDQEEGTVTQGGTYEVTWREVQKTSKSEGSQASEKEVNMSDVDAGKGPGRGRGKWTAKGVQAGVNADVEAMKVLMADMAARLDALEAGEPEVPVDPEVPFEPAEPEPEQPAEG